MALPWIERTVPLGRVRQSKLELDRENRPWIERTVSLGRVRQSKLELDRENGPWIERTVSLGRVRQSKLGLDRENGQRERLVKARERYGRRVMEKSIQGLKGIQNQISDVALALAPICLAGRCGGRRVVSNKCIKGHQGNMFFFQC